LFANLKTGLGGGVCFCTKVGTEKSNGGGVLQVSVGFSTVSKKVCFQERRWEKRGETVKNIANCSPQKKAGRGVDSPASWVKNGAGTLGLRETVGGKPRTSRGGKPNVTTGESPARTGNGLPEDSKGESQGALPPARGGIKSCGMKRFQRRVGQPQQRGEVNYKLQHKKTDVQKK